MLHNKTYKQSFDLSVIIKWYYIKPKKNKTFCYYFHDILYNKIHLRIEFSFKIIKNNKDQDSCCTKCLQTSNIVCIFSQDLKNRNRTGSSLKTGRGTHSDILLLLSLICSSMIMANSLMLLYYYLTYDCHIHVYHAKTCNKTHTSKWQAVSTQHPDVLTSILLMHGLCCNIYF